jgi:hypothetical protein
MDAWMLNRSIPDHAKDQEKEKSSVPKALSPRTIPQFVKLLLRCLQPLFEVVHFALQPFR